MATFQRDMQEMISDKWNRKVERISGKSQKNTYGNIALHYKVQANRIYKAGCELLSGVILISLVVNAAEVPLSKALKTSGSPHNS